MDVINVDANGNKIAGFAPWINNSTIKFAGKNNVLYCEKNAKIINSIIKFRGNGSLIYLGASKHRIQVDIYNNSVLHCGKNNTYTDGEGYNRVLRFLLSEQKHCFIGDSCLFSYDTVIRNSDPHLLYDCDSGDRINSTKSVYIGDHVWVGQSAFIFKGTYIDSGSVIGARAVVSGKRINHNTVWGGVPARELKDNVFWDSTCVHSFEDELTAVSMKYDTLLKYKKKKYTG